MRVLHLNKEVDNSFLQEKMKAAKSAADFKRWQIIFHVKNYPVDAQYLSSITGYSKANVYSIVQCFNNDESMDVGLKPKGGRKRELMSQEEEKSMMESLTDRALQGHILTGKDIRQIVEQKLNRPVSDDYIWDLFKRNGWTKHTPRPHHPQRDSQKQEEFKKNLKSIWLPLKMTLTQH
jgi:transposase